MTPILIHMVLPAAEDAREGESLNVLLVTENPTDRELTATVRFYGSLGGPWRELLAQEQVFPAHSHPHLYFNIPASCLSPAFWDGERVEELSLHAGFAPPPAPGGRGTLVFFQ